MSKLKNYKKIGFVAVLVCLAVVFGFYFFNLDYAKASPGKVEFTADVILDLTGLDTTTYIASGSKCDSLTISGTTLTVNTIDSNNPFLLKTSGHKILQITPTAGTADFIFSSSNFSAGYLKQWQEKSSVSTSHTVGVSAVNSDYIVKANGSPISGSPFNSGSSAEINFTRTGSGAWETYTIESPPCQNHNVWGWAWSENVGWFSFSCRNTMAEGSGVNYGVDIDPVSGDFSGYAWSDNIGWLSFEPADLTGCPGGACKANLNLETRQVSGWARTLNYGDGWDGWLKLSGSWPNGVILNPLPEPAEFEGWAWDSGLIGWLSFNCSNSGACASSDYKVMTDLNLPPNQPDGLNETWDYCNFSGLAQLNTGVSVILNWQYSDPENDPQTSYEIWLDSDPAFSGPKFNHLVNSSSQSYALNLNNDDEGDWLSSLNWGTTYYWKVRVRDDGDIWSEFSGNNSFLMPAHAYPNPDFSWQPENPPAEVEVAFSDSSICYSAGGQYDCRDSAFTSYLWDFGDSNTDNTKGDTAHTYETVEDFDVSLRIDDELGFCQKTLPLSAQLPLPEWKEISPF